MIMMLKKWISNRLKFKAVAPVLIFSCVSLIGFSGANISSAEMKHETTIERKLAKLEDTYDAKLGVYALDTGTNKVISYRPDERFGYASTHKALAVGVLLQQKDIKDLDKRITYTRDDLVNYNPITEKYVDVGMTLKELSDASLRYSDNTAGNLILEEIGGPIGFKKALRELGDDVTNPVRIEPELNDVPPGEIADTSTAKALATSLQAFTLGDALPVEKRELLIDWMKRNTTGDALIRSGVPKNWEVADKTGAGLYGTRNDIAVIWPKKGDPIVLAVLSSRNEKDASYDDKLIAEATKEVVKSLKGKSH